MQVERVIKGREGFTNELQVTENTDMLLRNNEIFTGMKAFDVFYCFHYYRSKSYGHPRYFLDGIEENFLFDSPLDSGIGFTEYGTMTYEDDGDRYLETPSHLYNTVANFYNGYLGASISGGSGDNRTISLIFKAVNADTHGTRVLFSQRVAANLGYHIAFTDRLLYVRFYDSSNNILLDEYVVDTEIELNVWTHIVMTHDSNTMDFYINGIKTKTQTFSGTIAYNNAFYLGNMLTGAYQFKGLMQGLTVFEEYLSPETAFKFFDSIKPYLYFYSRATDTSIVFGMWETGTWSEVFSTAYPTPHYILASSTATDDVEYRFEGSKIELFLIYNSTDGGVCGIYLDDTLVDTIDTSTSDGIGIAYTNTAIDAGIHFLQVVVTSGVIRVWGIKTYKEYQKRSIENLDYLYDEDPVSYYPIETSLPRLKPRREKRRNEYKVTYWKYLDGTDTNMASENGAKLGYTEVLSERRTNSQSGVNNYGHPVASFVAGGQFVASDTPASDGGTSRTLGVWFRHTSADIGSGYHSVVSQRETGNNVGYSLFITTIGSIYFRVYDASNVSVMNHYGTTVVDVDRWHHMALSHDSSNWYLYLNGVLEASGTVTGTPDYTSSSFRFGAHTDANTYQFNGYAAGFFMISEYWNAASILSYYTESREFFRVAPSDVTITQHDDVEYALTDYLNDYLELKNIIIDKGEWFKITFKGTILDFHGVLNEIGGNGFVYVNGVYDGAISCFNATDDYGTLYTVDTETFGTHEVLITNTSAFSGQYLYITYISQEYKHAQITDCSGKNNHCTLEQNGSFFDITNVRGLNNNTLPFADGGAFGSLTACSGTDMYQTLGDKFYLGIWFRPNSRATSDSNMLIFDTYYHSEAVNNELITVVYFQDVTNSTDKIIIQGEFIDETIDLTEELDINDNWFFLGIIVDSTEETTEIIFGKREDNTLLVDTSFNFITSTDYEREDINIARFSGTGDGTFNYLTADLDGLIFEGTTEFTIDDIKSYFYLESPCSGGMNELTNNIHAINVEEVLEISKIGIETYDTYGTYTSKIYKLSNDRFTGYGKLILTYDKLKNEQIYDIQTRSSANAETNSPTWSSWTDLGDSSIIESPNNKYLQFKLSMSALWNRRNSPKISKIEILDIDINPFARKAFSLPIVYDADTNEKSAIINKNVGFKIVQEVNGADYIDFTFPFTSDKRSDIDTEFLVRVYDSIYVVRKITDSRDGGKLLTTIYAEAGFYDLQYSAPVKEREFSSVTPHDLLDYVLSDTGWELDECDIYITRDFSIENNANVLELIRSIQALYGGDIIFNNEAKKVSFFTDSSVDNGVLFTYDKNVRVTRVIDSFDHVNRLYVYGENGINISEYNNGFEYLEIPYTGLTTNKAKIINNENFTCDCELYKYALYLQSKYSTQNISYEIEAKYLVAQDEINIPEYNIGDIVTVYDKELNVTLATRIVAMTYNVLNPPASSLVLSSQLRSLGDDISEFMRYNNKLKKVNFRVLILMMRQFLTTIDREQGYILKGKAEIIEVVQTVSYARIKVTNTTEYVDIRVSASGTATISGSLRHGTKIKIVGETDLYYKIDLTYS